MYSGKIQLNLSEDKVMKINISDVLKLWGIQAEAVQIYGTAWAIGEDYVLKSSTNMGWLEQNIKMMKQLEESGIPVAKPIPTMDGREYVDFVGVYYLLMNKLPGSHIVDIYQADYRKIAYDTGIVVAKLHNAFHDCEYKITCWNNNMIDEMNGWIYDTFITNQFRYCLKSDVDLTINELKSCYDKLPRQLIHRDIHFGNILFNNGEFSGYIDFDLSQIDVRIFDISYFLMGLLIDHYKNENDIEKWYGILTGFINGYETINKLVELEKQSLSCLMKNIELLFVAYFMREGKENLAENAADLYYFVVKNENAIQTAFSSNICFK